MISSNEITFEKHFPSRTVQYAAKRTLDTHYLYDYELNLKPIRPSTYHQAPHSHGPSSPHDLACITPHQAWQSSQPSSSTLSLQRPAQHLHPSTRKAGHRYAKANSHPTDLTTVYRRAGPLARPYILLVILFLPTDCTRSSAMLYRIARMYIV